jgi:hypothetical protein
MLDLHHSDGEHRKICNKRMMKMASSKSRRRTWRRLDAHLHLDDGDGMVQVKEEDKFVLAWSDMLDIGEFELNMWIKKCNYC